MPSVYHRPRLRSHEVLSDVPKVVIVHDHRSLASGLRMVLADRAAVVGDTTYGAVALQLADVLLPDVIVIGELLGDGLVDYFLPRLLALGSRVLLIADGMSTDRQVELVGQGVAGVCSSDARLEELAGAVLEVAAHGAALPSPIVNSIVARWRSLRWSDAATTLTAGLTVRETEVLNALADGLSTKATARRLGVAIKTVEAHRTRTFAKLGVRNQAQAVAALRSRRGEWSATLEVSATMRSSGRTDV